MPVVPIQAPQQISTDVPGASVNPLQSVGQTGRALQAQAGALGGESLEILAHIRHAEAASDSADAYSQSVVTSNSTLQEMKTRSKDGYMTNDAGDYEMNPDGSRRTLTQEYRDWANDHFQQAQDAMPSGLAKTMYQEKALPYFTGQIVHAQNEQHQIMIQSAKASDDEMTQRLSDTLVSSPDVRQAYDFSNTITTSIQQKANSVYGAPIAQEKIRLSNEQISESLIRGAYSQILSSSRSGSSQFTRASDVDRWLAVVDGMDPDSKQRAEAGLPTLTNMFKPDTKAALRDQLINLKKIATDLDVSATNQFLTDARARAEMGQGSPQLDHQVRGVIGQAAASGKWKPIEAADKLAEYMASRGVGLVDTPQFRLQSPAEQESSVKSGARTVNASAAAGGPVAGGKAMQEYVKKSEEAMKKSQAEKEDDFNGYTQKNDREIGSTLGSLDFSNPASLAGKGPAIQSVIQKAKTYYDHNFPSDDTYWRVVSDDQSDKLAAVLKSPELGPEQTAQAIQVLKKEFGHYYPDLIGDMIADGKLDESYRMASYYQSDATTSSVVSAIKGAKPDEKIFQTMLSSAGTNKNDFNSAVNSKLRPWSDSLVAENPNDPQTRQNTATTNKSVADRAKQLFVQGMTKDKAAGAAISELLESNFSNVKVSANWGFWNGSGASYTMRIPNETATQKLGKTEKSQIIKYVQDNNTADGLKSIGLASPPSAPTDWYEKVAKTGHFAMDQGAQGYNYFYTDPTSGHVVRARSLGPDGKNAFLYIPISTMINGGQ